jgi:hypothetical protein
MGPSIRPKWSDDGKHALRRLIDAWPVIAGIAAGAAATYGWMEGQLTEHITDVATPIAQQSTDAHRTEMAAHIEDFRVHKQSFVELTTNMDECNQDLAELYWYYVGDKASDLEPRRTRKADTAARARDRFERYVREGDTLKEAFQKTLRVRPP